MSEWTAMCRHGYRGPCGLCDLEASGLPRSRPGPCKSESDQPTIREALDAAHAAGGDAWDRVDDPGALIAEYRGEVQPPGIPAERGESCES